MPPTAQPTLTRDLLLLGGILILGLLILAEEAASDLRKTFLP